MAATWKILKCHMKTQNEVDMKNACNANLKSPTWNPQPEIPNMKYPIGAILYPLSPGKTLTTDPPNTLVEDGDILDAISLKS